MSVPYHECPMKYTISSTESKENTGLQKHFWGSYSMILLWANGRVNQKKNDKEKLWESHAKTRFFSYFLGNDWVIHLDDKESLF